MGRGAPLGPGGLTEFSSPSPAPSGFGDSPPGHREERYTGGSLSFGVEMNRIRAARKALGWTQEELARTAKVSARTIHAVEQGRICRQATKRQILLALGVPWNLKDEYFTPAHSVRRIRYAEKVRNASGA